MNTNYHQNQHNWNYTTLDDILNNIERSNSFDERPTTSSANHNLDFIDFNDELHTTYDIETPSTSTGTQQTSHINNFNIPFDTREQQTFSNLIMHDLQNIIEEESKTGLPEEYINCIKVMKMGSSTRTCSVCFNSFQKGEKIRKLPCEHIFHDDCMLPWLQTNVTCPNCRLNLLEYYTKNANDYSRECINNIQNSS